jgi:hypothetical protein
MPRSWLPHALRSALPARVRTRAALAGGAAAGGARVLRRA